MILTCPQCATRYQVAGDKFPPAGRNVRCAKCGHVWHQPGPVPEPEPVLAAEVHEPVREPVRETVREPVHESAHVSEPVPEAPPPRVASFAPAPRVQAFVPEPVAQAVAAEEERVVPKARSLGRVAVVGGWAFLALLVLTLGWAVIHYRDSVVALLPQTSSVYRAAGMHVKPPGLDIADVTYQRRVVDGQVVLTVNGRIVNRGSNELSVPLVRVTLFDGDRRELTHWTSVPGLSTLKPGETARFRAQLSSPPPNTQDMEVRFARSGE